MSSSLPLRAVVLSLLGAAIGGSLWILTAISADLERALPALLIGIFAGLAPRLETERGRLVQVSALVFTIVGLVVVQYFVVRHAIVSDLVDQSVPVLLSPGSMAFVTFGWLRVYPIDALLWVVTGALAFVLPSGSDPVAPSHRPLADTV